MVAERLVPVEMHAVADQWSEVSARIADPDRGRELVAFSGPFGRAAVRFLVARGRVAVVGDGVAPVVVEARQWPASAHDLATGLVGTVGEDSLWIRADLRSWRPSRRVVEVTVDDHVTHRLHKVPWRDELSLHSTEDGSIVGRALPPAVSPWASPRDVSLVLLLATVDLVDGMTFAHGVLRYV